MKETWWVVETARRHLGLLHILEERRVGMPCRTWYHINMDVLTCVIAAYQMPLS